MPEDPEKERVRCYPKWLGAAAIFLTAFGVYWPALQGQFLWDDFLVVHRNPLVTGSLRLGSVWFRTDFPLTTVIFWLEWLLWHQQSLGYHVVNVVLHATGAVLLWRLLRQMEIAGAWWAAMLFVVHPLCAGSVAWIAELKNTLSLPFFLISLLLYLKSETVSHRKSQALLYCVSVGAFLLALLSKTSTVGLPLVLVGCAWWQRGRVAWRDVLRILPYVALAVAFGCLTIRHQAEGAIVTATVQTLGFWGRFAGAGMALWFYLGKALLPVNLMAIYPLWQINAASLTTYVPLVLWCALLVLGWALRARLGRGLFFALGSFTVLLLPVLGFVDMFYLAISRVADHFCYLPLIAIVGLVAALLTTGSFWMESKAALPATHVLRLMFGAAVLIGLGSATFLQARVWQTEEALWRDTLDRNPAAWPAHANLGWILAEKQQWDEAQAHLLAALELRPENAQAHSNLGRILALQHRFGDAESHFEAALRIKPKDTEIRRAYASALAEQGRRGEAIEQLRQALRLAPDADAQGQLASLYYQTGNAREAVAEFRLALAAKPDQAEWLSNLAWLLAASSDPAVRNGPEAVRLAEKACQLKNYQEVQMLGTLSAAYAEAGRFPDAIATAQKALELATRTNNPQFVAVARQFLQLFGSGHPYHEPPPAQPASGRK